MQINSLLTRLDEHARSSVHDDSFNSPSLRWSSGASATGFEPSGPPHYSTPTSSVSHHVLPPPLHHNHTQAPYDFNAQLRRLLLVRETDVLRVSTFQDESTEMAHSTSFPVSLCSSAQHPGHPSSRTNSAVQVNNQANAPIVFNSPPRRIRLPCPQRLRSTAGPCRALRDTFLTRPLQCLRPSIETRTMAPRGWRGFFLPKSLSLF